MAPNTIHSLESTQQAPVLSLFFRGTNHHREAQTTDRSLKKRIIDQFVDASVDNSTTSVKADQPAHYVYSFDGVGSKSPQKNSQHPTPGTYTFVPDKERPCHGEKIRRPVNSRAWKLFGGAFGAGAEHLVMEAYQLLGQLEEMGKIPGVINLTGFSRGAYTALLTAQMIKRLYPDIRVNLFLIDLVPGPGRKRDVDALLIPSNVDNCTVVLQKHEDGSAFEVLDKSRLLLEDPTQTRLVFETLPGQHGGSLRTDTPETAALPQLVWALLYNFLKENGSQFSHDPNYIQHLRDKSGKVGTTQELVFNDDTLTPAGLLLLYQQLHNNEWLYAKKARTPVKRAFLSHMNDYVLDSEFFISQRHRELFKHFLPKTFDYRFQQTTEAGSKTLEDYQNEIRNELLAFKREHPKLYDSLRESLAAMGFEYDEETASFVLPAKPQGHLHAEKSPVLEGLPPGDTPLNLLNYQLNAAIQEAQRSDREVRQRANALQTEIKKINQTDVDNWVKIHRINAAIAHTRTNLRTKPSTFSRRLDTILHPGERLGYDLLDVFENHLKNNNELIKDHTLKEALQQQCDKVHNILKEKIPSQEKQSQFQAIVREMFSPKSTLFTRKAWHLLYDVALVATQPHPRQRYLNQLIHQTSRYLVKNRLRQSFQTLIAKLTRQDPQKTTELTVMKHNLMMRFFEDLTALKSQSNYSSQAILAAVDKYLPDAMEMSYLWGKRGGGESAALLQHIKNDLLRTVVVTEQHAYSRDFTLFHR